MPVMVDMEVWARKWFFWAKFNTEKIGLITKYILSNVNGLSSAIFRNDIKLGQFCEETSKNVTKLDYPFPKFDIKYVPKTELFNGKTKKQIAENLMKLVNKFGFIFVSLYYDPLNSGLFRCNVPEKDRDITATYHYVAVAGVKYDKTSDSYYALIHNSWGGSSYNQIEIKDGYIECNMSNAMFVLEAKQEGALNLNFLQ